MSFSPYFLVSWNGENKHSCISRQKIVDGVLRKESDAKLLTLENLEIIFNRKVYKGKLLYAGATQNEITLRMKSYEHEFDAVNSEPASGSEKLPAQKTARQKKRSVASGIEKVIKEKELRSLASVDLEHANGTLQCDPSSSMVTEREPRRIRKLEKKLRKANQKIDTLESQLTAERELHAKYKSKCKSLRHKISKFEADKTTTIEIGVGVPVSAVLLERARLLSSSPAVLGRNIFRLVFQDAELTGKSLFGRQCNANKLLAAKPSVDPSKRDAVISYCMSVLEEDCKKSGLKFERIMTRGKISKSLGEYIREVNYKDSIGVAAQDMEADVN